jgi:hypothetical protein
MKKITLVCVGTVHHDLMKFSIEKSLENVKDCEEVLTVSNKKIIDDARYVTIPDDFDIKAYSHFMLKELDQYIHTEFALIIQYDGMAVRKEFWNDDFYKYDYIGAPWPTRFNWIQNDERVGNGGFSLRSKKLLEVLKDRSIFIGNDLRSSNEDAIICQSGSAYLRQVYGIQYAQIELANVFATEWCNPSGNTFGFHGAWNFPLFFSEQETKDYLSHFPQSYWLNDRKDMLDRILSKRNYEL